MGAHGGIFNGEVLGAGLCFKGTSENADSRTSPHLVCAVMTWRTSSGAQHPRTSCSGPSPKPVTGALCLNPWSFQSLPCRPPSPGHTCFCLPSSRSLFVLVSFYCVALQ